jgi:uncharacterized membrane protein YphA (DoxX/SURF4 family)
VAVAGALARVAVGFVFSLSGFLKHRDAAWPESAAAFGLPRWAARLLPVVETVVGALVAAQLRAAALVALGLLLAFTVAIAIRVARRDAVPCACFGQRSSRPVGPHTLARNGALVALAVLAAFL